MHQQACGRTPDVQLLRLHITDVVLLPHCAADQQIVNDLGSLMGRKEGTIETRFLRVIEKGVYEKHIFPVRVLHAG